MIKNTVAILLLVYSCFTNAEIYKWVDEQGRTHYEDKPVGNAKEMEINTEKQGHIKVNKERELKQQRLLETYEDDLQRKNEEIARKKKKKKKLARECYQAKNRLKHYERASSLYDLDKNGKRITMSNIEREKATAVLRNKIKKSCK
ncbi:MAG: hypothetical protein DIZ80_10995 [endosymbiont of Galathealinum brachiosum]|uniref:DUF4124 domain-containing protein n=1 Tax=endosymbiont of Galathealinum brachiosum TaxID=2200906 RepID=A0A370DD59_9GAMM|nr:MAG: hypothetical protein DIZ80_10995 [endosymbiont of Galathealinum brachiosum]